MKKQLLKNSFFFLLCLVSFSLSAQNIFDDFESYTVDEYVGPQSDLWTTWSGAEAGGEDAFISSEFAQSGSNSLKLTGGGTVDILMLPGERATGAYQFEMDIYVVAGATAYFNMQHYATPAIEWAYEVYFNADGTGSLNAGVTDAATFTYAQDTWVHISQYIDLDNDSTSMSIDDVELYNWPFSDQANATGGIAQIGGLNLFPPDAASLYYVDNVTLVEIPTACTPVDALICDNMENYTADSIVLPQGTNWATWSGAESESGEVSTDYAYNGFNSIEFDGATGTKDMLFLLGDLTSGMYDLAFQMYIPSGKDAYYNIQHYEAPGQEWANEIAFNLDGTGSISAGGQDAATFNYPSGTWFTVHQTIDLNHDRSEIIINDEVVYEWKFSVSSDDPSSFDLSLGSLNFFTIASSQFYVDNIVMTEIPCLANAGSISAPANTTVIQGETMDPPAIIGEYEGDDYEYQLVVTQDANTSDGILYDIVGFTSGSTINTSALNLEPGTYNVHGISLWKWTLDALFAPPQGPVFSGEAVATLIENGSICADLIVPGFEITVEACQSAAGTVTPPANTVVEVGNSSEAPTVDGESEVEDYIYAFVLTTDLDSEDEVLYDIIASNQTGIFDFTEGMTGTYNVHGLSMPATSYENLLNLIEFDFVNSGEDVLERFMTFGECGELLVPGYQLEVVNCQASAGIVTPPTTTEIIWPGMAEAPTVTDQLENENYSYVFILTTDLDSGDDVTYDILEFNNFGGFDLSDYELGTYNVHGLSFRTEDLGTLVNAIETGVITSGEAALAAINDGTVCADLLVPGYQLTLDYAEGLESWNLESLSLSPVPTQNTLQVAFSSEIAGPIQWEIRDISGRLIQQQKNVINNGLNQFKLDVSHLSSGLYLFYMQSEEGFVSQKFVKE